jgi:hypothetical protein
MGWKDVFFVNPFFFFFCVVSFLARGALSALRAGIFYRLDPTGFFGFWVFAGTPPP